MLRTRAVFLVCSLALTPACGKKGQSPVAAKPATSSPAGENRGLPAVRADPSVPRAHVRVIMDDIGSAVSAIDRMVAGLDPRPPGEPPRKLLSEVGAFAVGMGFAPTFFENIDFAGRFAADFEFPIDGATVIENWKLAARIPANDGARVVAGLPSTLSAQPLGQNLWQILAEDGMQILIRAQARSVEVGLEMSDLDRAGAMGEQPPPGPTLRIISDGAWPREWVNMQDEFGEFGAALDGVFGEIKRAEASLDLAETRDFVFSLHAEGPFGRFGLSTLGSALTSPGAGALALPPGAAAVMEFSLGNPAAAHRSLEGLTAKQPIPAPFDALVANAAKAVHGLLDAAKDRVVVALYLDKSGKMSIAILSAVSDEAAMRDSVRGLLTSLELAARAHIELSANDPEMRYTATFARDVVRAGSARGDMLTITLPKAMHRDSRALSSLVGKNKPKLEIASIVHAGHAVVVVGPGAKPLAGQIAGQVGRSRTRNLESDGGLAIARGKEGCQICMAADPLALVRIFLTSLRDGGDHPKASASLKALARIQLGGLVASELTIAKDRAHSALVVQKSLLFADPRHLGRLQELLSAADERKIAEAPAVPK